MDGWREGGREADIGKEDYVQHSSRIVVDLCVEIQGCVNSINRCGLMIYSQPINT